MDGARNGTTGGETEILIPCSPPVHAHTRTQEGVAVAFCVVRLLRNGSETKFFQQPGRFQARTRFLSHAPGERVGRLPAHALHPPRKAHDTWHSAPNHMEPSSAAPRPGLRDACCHPCLCKCVIIYVRCVSVPRDEWDRLPDIIASAWSHLTSHLTPNTNTRGRVGQS